MGIALGLRFWQVTSLELWPTGDEALHAEAGLAIAERGDWRFLYTAGQAPPTLFWIYGVFFKFIHSVPFNLWVPPAIISFLTVFMGYGAARQYLSKSLSFLMAGLLALSYWPLLLGRVCVEGIVVPFVSLASFYFFGKYLKAAGPPRVVLVFVLGIITGLNSFTFTAWPVVVLFLGILVAWETLVPRKRKLLDFFVFLAGLGLALDPWFYECYRLGFGHHISDVAAWSHPFNLLDQGTVVFNYVSVLVWGTVNGDHFVAPAAGGFLNPVLGAFFVIGLARLGGRFSMPFARALVLCMALFLLPGFLTINMDGMRIVQLIAPLLLVTAVGIQTFLERIQLGKEWVLAGLLLFTGVFDAGRLFTPYWEAVQQPNRLLAFGKSPSRYEAYVILKDWESRMGPGIILGEWDVPADRSLEVMTYYFNVLRGARSASPPAWLALVTDAHYLPFLKARFPEGDWRVLDADLNMDKPRLLGIMKFDDSNRDQLNHWAKADPGFTLLNWDLDHLHDKGLMDRFGHDVQNCGNWVQDDPLLAAMFWEKVGATYYYFGHHYPEHLSALENAVKYGYPASHLYGELSSLYWVGGNQKAAAEALREAKASEAKYPWR